MGLLLRSSLLIPTISASLIRHFIPVTLSHSESYLYDSLNCVSSEIFVENPESAKSGRLQFLKCSSSLLKSNLISPSNFPADEKYRLHSPQRIRLHTSLG